MKQVRWISLIVIATLLLSGCGSSGGSAEPAVAALPAQDLGPAMALVNNPLPAGDGEAEPDECLACHADKEMLIETGKPVEEPAESESSGVG
ncbi:MAG: hypothetical protein AB1846_05035 [Chloroflexota bacterium]